MNAQQRDTYQDDIEEVDLDAMTTVELLRERAEVMAAIPMITAQLQDKNRRPTAPEDGSPEWDEYRNWRRRARLALAHQKADLVTIRNILSERQDVAYVGNQLRIATLAPEQLTEIELQGIERGRRLQEALQSQSAEGLLIRAYRILRHLLADHVNTLPDSLDADDRDALMLVGMHVRQRYGTGRVKRFVDGGTRP